MLHVGWATAQLYCKEGLLCCNTISVLQVGKAGRLVVSQYNRVYCGIGGKLGRILYCSLGERCIAILLVGWQLYCNIVVSGRAKEAGTVSQYSSEYCDRGQRQKAGLCCNTTQLAQDTALLCAQQGARGRRHGSRTRPRYDSLALGHDHLGPATRPAGRPRYGAGRAAGARGEQVLAVGRRALGHGRKRARRAVGMLRYVS